MLNNARKRDEYAGISHRIDAIELIYIHLVKRFAQKRQKKTCLSVILGFLRYKVIVDEA